LPVLILFGGAALSQALKNPLVEYNNAIDDLIRRVAPSVVQVVVSGYGPQGDSDRRNTGAVIERQRAIGSGFVIDSDGYIMTNAHVISGAGRIQVILPPAGSKDAIGAALSTKTKIV